MTKNAPRLAVLSDVHGNLAALQAVLDDMQQYGADGIIAAGDFIGGPQPDETLQNESQDLWRPA